MVVGVGTVQLEIGGSESLKDKRRVVKSIIQRVRNQYNVTIAEVGGHDTHTQATLGYACVGNDRPFVDSKMQKIANFIDELCLAEIVDDQFELIQW
ncbi:MAG: DUF503 domain-containing protein [Myxococcales bacterium]|nr:DUF503 domain-containing protein [Myxococcales bacterium]